MKNVKAQNVKANWQSADDEGQRHLTVFGGRFPHTNQMQIETQISTKVPQFFHILFDGYKDEFNGYLKPHKESKESSVI